MSDGINRYIDLSNCEGYDLYLPSIERHKFLVDKDGIKIFDLEPYSITQMVEAGEKLDWYYVDTGHDGHGIRTFEKAKMVLRQSIKWHQEAVLLQLESTKEPKS